MYKAIVFDVDGTMVDTEDAVAETKLKMLAELGRSMDREELLKSIWGKPRYKSFELLGIVDNQENHDKVTRYMHEFSSYIRFYDGIQDCIRRLHRQGLRLGIVTSRMREELGYDIEASGLAPLFETVICYEDTPEHKPHPAPLQLFMRRSGLKAEDILYIGDTIYDMECANAAGIDYGIAGWGAMEPEKLKGAYRLQHPDEILEIFGLKV